MLKEMNEVSYALPHQSLKTLESLYKILETLKKELEFLLVMVREQLPKGNLLIDSMRAFRCSISTHNACIPSSIKEDEVVLILKLEYLLLNAVVMIK